MDPEFIAKLTLAAFAAIGVVIVLWQAVRCEGGWQVWLLYCVQRTYSGMRYHWRANRRCPFPQTGPALIIANHRSPIDPMMVWTNSHLTGRRNRIRVIGFLMAREYYDIRRFRWLYRALQSIPVERGGKDMAPARNALRRLQAGKLVGVFPEGGIHLGEELSDASPGIAWLALRAQVPVYPVYIHGAPQGDHMVEPFLKLARVRVTYGDAIDLSAYAGRRKSRELLTEVTELLMARLAELGGVSCGKPDAPKKNETLPFERATG